VISASRFIREVCAFYHRPVYFQIKIAPAFVSFVAKLLGKKLHPWDIYSIKRRHFEYKVVNPTTFSLPSRYRSLAAILEDVKK
jgi:hypothetical protein